MKSKEIVMIREVEKKEDEMNKRNALSWLSVAILVVVLCMFSFFVVFETHHNCTDDHCPICSCIEICHRLLHQMGSGVSSPVIGIYPLALVLCVVLSSETGYFSESLVEKKVRLDR